MLVCIAVTDLPFFASVEEQLYGHQTIHGYVCEEIYLIKRNTMPKTACQNLARITFGDCLKSAYLASRTSILISPDLGSPDFSPLSYRPIGMKFGIRVLLINAHGHFLGFPKFQFFPKILHFLNDFRLLQFYTIPMYPSKFVADPLVILRWNLVCSFSFTYFFSHDESWFSFFR